MQILYANYMLFSPTIVAPYGAEKFAGLSVGSHCVCWTKHTRHAFIYVADSDARLRVRVGLLACALKWTARVYAVDGGASVCLAETLDAGMLETRADWSILWRLWPCSAIRMSRKRAGHRSSTGDTHTDHMISHFVCMRLHVFCVWANTSRWSALKI